MYVHIHVHSNLHVHVCICAYLQPIYIVKRNFYHKLHSVTLWTQSNGSSINSLLLLFIIGPPSTYVLSNHCPLHMWIRKETEERPRSFKKRTTQVRVAGCPKTISVFHRRLLTIHPAY